MLAEAAETYRLARTDSANEYLAARGIDQATADTNLLGVVTEPLPGHEKYVGRLAIPFIGHDGRVLSIRFRRADWTGDTQSPKYMGVAGDSTRVYNVRAIHTAKNTIHITEGELDAVILNKVGLPAIGIPGANNWKPHYTRMLAGFARVWVWGDPDDAGAEFVNTVTKAMRQAKGVAIRSGDITDTYVSVGGGTLGAQVLHGLVAE